MKSVEINGQIIDVIIERKKVKNINLRVRENKIYVSANKKVPEGFIFDFINRNVEFIEKSINKDRKKLRYSISNLQENPQGKIFLFGNCYAYKFIESNIKNIEVTENTITIYSPNTQVAQGVLEGYLKESLSEYVGAINTKIYSIFKNYGVEKPDINFRKMKSRWGSCYYNKKKIFLNTALVTSPKECIEYVLFHEYTHFLYPNHQKEFYSFLSKYVPDYKLIKNHLNTFEKC